MYDLLIKSGRVIDPAQGIDDKLDVAITGSCIAAVSRNIPPTEGRQVVDASDKIVTPGLIDLHCHVYSAICKNGLEPDDAGVKQGVTTVVDAGSAGHAIFGGFPKYVVPPSRTTVFCFLHVASQGLTVGPELRDWKEFDPEGIESTIESNKGLIKGIKVRMVGKVVASSGVEVVKRAKVIAGRFHLPVMVHIGDKSNEVPPNATRELLSLLESGDILSHVYTGQPGGVLDGNGKVIPELKEAVQKGVVLDVANGRVNFSFEVARKVMDQGILPSTLSTDVNKASFNRIVFGMTVTMSKFMALGLDLKQIVQMSTVNPACAVGEHATVGSLKVGMTADVSIMAILTGLWKLSSETDSIQVNRLISPFAAVKSGRFIRSQPLAEPELVAA